jgi:hypothetical protein
MRNKIAKRIRRLIDQNAIEPMIMVRNHCGSRTEDMDANCLYKNYKRLYKQGKIKLPREQKRK